MNTIPVFFTFDRNYVVAAQVAIYSLLKYAAKQYRYELYVLHTELTRKHYRQLSRITNKFPNAALHFMDMSSYSDSEEVARLGVKAHFSKEIYYKLVAAELFPAYDRIICTDVDVVFLGDIAPSFFMHPDEFFYFAGVGQVIENARMNTYQQQFTDEEREKLKKEFGAGYMLLNLKAIREHNMQQQLTDFYKANYARLYLPEQDCIILCCYPHTFHLPITYCVTTDYYKAKRESLVLYQENEALPREPERAMSLFEEALAHPIQLHYVGMHKPWNSFGTTKQRVWFSLLCEAGCCFDFIRATPRFVRQRMKRYSLRRFIRKIKQRL
jgi:lipopolysaccharide biosynthesis glycosyltransferase